MALASSVQRFPATKIRMTLFTPDLNVWLSLSVSSHPHSKRAWLWLEDCPEGSKLFFSRYTQVGLLRLLTSTAVMGEQTITLRKAWSLYDRWLGDSRVEFHPEPRGLDAAFREATTPFASQTAPKVIGDCYLLALAAASRSALVTFDAALHALALRQGARCVMP